MIRGETRGGFLEEIILEHLKKEEDFDKPCVCAVVLCVCTWWVDTAFQGKQLAQMMILAVVDRGRQPLIQSP